MIKLFLSRQTGESLTVTNMAQRLRPYHRIPYYLDVIDAFVCRGVGDLLSHIRGQMSMYTQPLARTQATPDVFKAPRNSLGQ